ncbi:MAG TPA: hypothetical protein PLS50_00100 [Candidatus Dojkabacteria bacterium]|nr:hypothetical protein [Candidatus Dojkabacteria bacterium]
MKSEVIKGYILGVASLAIVLALSSCGREQDMSDTMSKGIVETTKKEDRVTPIPTPKPIQTKKVKVWVNPCG